MDKIITFKTTQEYLDDLEQQFNDELSVCIPKNKLKLVQNNLHFGLKSVKENVNIQVDFSCQTDVNNVIKQKQDLMQLYTYNRNSHTDEQIFLKHLSKIVTLPQMNINKICTKWVNLIDALYSDYFVRLEQKAQKRLNELQSNQELFIFFNSKNEKLATINKGGIFSFKMEPNDENTKEFLKILMDRFEMQIKQINYFEV